MVTKGGDWCFDCHDKQVMRERRRFGEPGDGMLYTEEP
jgi:hypothetical protein